MEETNNIGATAGNAGYIEHYLYEYGKCKLISKEVKYNMIENGQLYTVLKYIHLYE